MLHAADVEAEPAQPAPLCAGAGLVQVRVIVRVPVCPHAATEHAPGADQPPQLPLIGVITQFWFSRW